MRLWTAASFLLLWLSSAVALAQQPLIGGAGIEVGLVVSDLPKSVEFYGTALGLKPVTARSNVLRGEATAFQAGASIIHLHRVDPVPPEGTRGVMNANGFRLMTILVVGAADVTKRFEAAGLPAPKFSRLATFNVAFVADPDGNAIELVALDDDPGSAGISGFQIGLTVSDAERARQFYGYMLGLAERPAMRMPDTLATNTMQYMYRASTAMIKFWAPPTERSTTPREIAGARGVRYIVLRVDNLASARKALESKDVPSREQDGRLS